MSPQTPRAKPKGPGFRVACCLESPQIRQTVGTLKSVWYTAVPWAVELPAAYFREMLPAAASALGNISPWPFLLGSSLALADAEGRGCELVELKLMCSFNVLPDGLAFLQGNTTGFGLSLSGASMMASCLFKGLWVAPCP